MKFWYFVGATLPNECLSLESFTKVLPPSSAMSDFRPPYNNKSLLEMFFRNFQCTVKEQVLSSAMLQNLFRKDFSSTEEIGCVNTFGQMEMEYDTPPHNFDYVKLLLGGMFF